MSWLSAILWIVPAVGVANTLSKSLAGKRGRTRLATVLQNVFIVILLLTLLMGWLSPEYGVFIATLTLWLVCIWRIAVYIKR